MRARPSMGGKHERDRVVRIPGRGGAGQPREGAFHGRPADVSQSDDPRRPPPGRDGRHLSVLAHHRCAPLPVGEHGNRGRQPRIHRDRDRVVSRFPDRDRVARALLCVVVLRDARARPGKPALQRRRFRVPGRVRPIRLFPRPPLSPDPHRVSRLALSPERIGLFLRDCAPSCGGSRSESRWVLPIRGRRRASNATSSRTPIMASGRENSPAAERGCSSAASGCG